MIRNFFQSCDYDNGYSQALLDIKNWFWRHSASLKYYKMYNQRSIDMLLSAISNEHEILQKYGDFTEVKVDTDKDKRKITKVYLGGMEK